MAGFFGAFSNAFSLSEPYGERGIKNRTLFLQGAEKKPYFFCLLSFKETLRLNTGCPFGAVGIQTEVTEPQKLKCGRGLCFRQRSFHLAAGQHGQRIGIQIIQKILSPESGSATENRLSYSRTSASTAVGGVYPMDGGFHLGARLA